MVAADVSADASPHGPVVLTVGEARHLAGDVLRGVPGTWWAHVQAVGRAAQELLPAIGTRVTVAAWLHDIGYASALIDTGSHPVDGARWLQGRGIDPAVVSLVAWHSTALAETTERGLVAELKAFAVPDSVELDALTMVDMTTGPTGRRVPAGERISEVLERYHPDHEVHRAMTAAAPTVVAAVRQAAGRLGLPATG